VPASLPSFSRGLKLARFAVFLMLFQIVMTIVTSIKGASASTPDEVRSALSWLEYVMLANVAAALAMLIGVARAIPEFKRVRIDVTSLVIAAIGFAVAAASLLWTYNVLSTFVDIVVNPESSLDDLSSSIEDLKSLGKVASKTSVTALV
jgi:hypothetical protein